MFASRIIVLIGFLSMFSSLSLDGFYQETTFTEDPPSLVIVRDDHVATLEMDYDENARWGGQLWTVGLDGTDAVGYRIQWWPDAGDTTMMIKGLGCASEKSSGTAQFATQESPHQAVTANHVFQLQPLANDVTYHVRVAKLNSLGGECSAPTTMTFQGGNGSRVQDLRASMTFFDDFNLKDGPADELLWNNAMTPQTDPRFNLFFVNPQCHAHTMNGTLNGAKGDKSQVAQRPRKPLLIEDDVRRKIVFDMDGIFSGRSVWYLDLNPVNTDLTGHMSFSDANGDTGLPADVLRIRARGHEISVNLINSAGVSFNVATSELDDYGRSMNTNVRRAFDVRVGTDGIQIFVDGVSVLQADFDPGVFKPGIYHLLWSAIGYNTSKDDVPYFLSHWDNFGFDGPNVEPFEVHNYVTRIIGTDLQKAHNNSGQNPIFTINVPDDIRPVDAGVKNDIYLVFTYMKNDWSTFNISEGDHLLFNGVEYPLPEGGNNTSPLVPELVNYAGSALSNRVKIGEVESGETSPVLIGDNTIQFFATNTGIVNLHLEVHCPETSTMPSYTQPLEIHPYSRHQDLPKLGLPAKIINITGQGISPASDGDFGPELSGVVQVESLVGNTSWAGWAPQWLNVPVKSAETYSTGNTRGIAKVDLYLRPIDNDSTAGFHIQSIKTDVDAPSPQLRYDVPLDTRRVVNGEYELFLQATDSKGNKSHPSYNGFGFEWDATELSGAFRGVPVIVNNPVVGTFNFMGTNGSEWTINESWDGGLMPPYGYDGLITIAADCQVPESYFLQFSEGATVRVAENRNLTVK